MRPVERDDGDPCFIEAFEVERLKYLLVRATFDKEEKFTRREQLAAV